MAIEVTSGNTTFIQIAGSKPLVQPLEQASTFLAAGPVVLDSSSPVRVPSIANGVTAGFVAEGSQISDGDVAFDEVTLLPSTFKGLKVFVKLSQRVDPHLCGGPGRGNAYPPGHRRGQRTRRGTVGRYRGYQHRQGHLEADRDHHRRPGSRQPRFADRRAGRSPGQQRLPVALVMTSASFAALRKLKVGTSDKR